MRHDDFTDLRGLGAERDGSFQFIGTGNATLPIQRDRQRRSDEMHQIQNRPRRGLLAAAAEGRHGDTDLGHLTPGEVVVPRDLQTGAVMQAIGRAAARGGVDPNRYIVGNRAGPRNPATGLEEFFGDGPGAGDNPGAGEGPGGTPGHGGESPGTSPGGTSPGGMGGVGSANAADGTANSTTDGRNGAYGGSMPGTNSNSDNLAGFQAADMSGKSVAPSTSSVTGWSATDPNTNTSEDTLSWMDQLEAYVGSKLGPPNGKSLGVMGTAIGMMASPVGLAMAATSLAQSALGEDGVADNPAGNAGSDAANNGYSVAEDEPLPYVLPRRGLLTSRGVL